MSKIVPLMPDGQPSILSEADVTIARLKSVLDTAFLDCDIEEPDMLVAAEGLAYPCCVMIDTDRKLIQIETAHKLVDHSGDPDSLINDLNESVILLQFHHDQGSIWGNYWMTYDTGLNIRQFVKMLRRFASTFESSIRSLG
jgi:hypothetical protein